MKYNIKAPDGVMLTIEGPEGASPEEVKQRAMAGYTPDPEKMKSLAISKAASDKIDASVKASPMEGMSTLEKGIAGFQGGLGDKLIGTGQAIASLVGADEEGKQLAEKAAERKKLNANLYGTGAGATGEVVGNILPELAPIGKVTKGVTALTKGLPMIPKVVKGLLPGAAAGAISGATTADENYDLASAAGKGSLWGIGGDVGARIAGRLLNPLGQVTDKLKETAAEQVARIKPKIDSLLAENLTDSGAVRAITNVMGQTFPFQGAVKRARDKVSSEATEYLTGHTPKQVGELSESARTAMQTAKDTKYDEFRNLPERVPVLAPPSLRESLTDALRVAEHGGGEGAANRLQAQIKAAGADVPDVAGSYTPVELKDKVRKISAGAQVGGAPTSTLKAVPGETTMLPGVETGVAPRSTLASVPGPNGKILISTGEEVGAPATRVSARTAKDLVDAGKESATPFSKLVDTKYKQFEATGPVKNLPDMSVKEAMALRKKLSDDFYTTTDVSKKDAIGAQLDALDEGLKAGIGTKQFDDFKRLQEQHGMMSDILSTTGKGAPYANLQGLAERRLPGAKVATSDVDKFIAAASERIKPGPTTENRAPLVKMLMSAGGPAAMFGAGSAVSAASDSDFLGAGVGAGVPLAALLALTTPGGGRYLTGNARNRFGKAAQSEETKKMIQLLMQTGSAELGTH